jgi:beta-lactamase class A
VLVGGGLLLLAACDKPMPLTASTTPKLDMKGLNEGVAAISARAAPGVLGAGLMNLESGEHWTFNGERRFPMQSVFKLPLGAMVLAEAEARRLDLAEVVRVGEMDLAPPFSPIAEAWPGRQDYSLRELLVAAVGQSDNTAADVLMRRVGGPGAVTAWLQTRDITEVRVDRYERELQPEASGMSPFRPGWRGPRFMALRETIAPEIRRAALVRYMADPRDTATPRGMLTLLAKLDSGQLISAPSTRLLLQIMAATTTGPGRLKAGFPDDAVVAHKTGNGGTVLGVNPAANDVGVISLKDRRSYAAAVFLSGSTLDDGGRDKVIADVARLMAQSLGKDGR